MKWSWSKKGNAVPTFAFDHSKFNFLLFLKLRLTPSRSEQPLQDVGLQEKEAQKKLEQTGN